ncbi:GH3 auxin-responsive promoter family protein [Planctomycetota bacterium]|nr:GH3 auxin-responsive promoter family protein [Planctomycetota bacterium]
MKICEIAYQMWQLSQRRTVQCFSKALNMPQQVQRQILLSTIQRNKNTAFGKRYHFHAISTLEEYQNRVPLCEYADIESDINRIKNGESSILTDDKITHLIPTSGTTSAAKLIPYTKRLQSQFNAGIGPWIADLVRLFPDLLRGPAYWSISPTIAVQQNSSVVPIGFEDDTSYLGFFGRWLIQSTLAVPNDVRHICDENDFRYLTLLHLLRAKDLRLVSIWHPSFWSLLMERLDQWWLQLVYDLQHGTCNLPSGSRLKIRFGKKRIRDLKNTKPDDWKAIWPKICVISAWGDAAAELPFSQLQRDWSHTYCQPKGIISTESFLSLPWQGKYPAAVCSHFIELLGDDGRCVDLASAEKDGVYEPVLTTAGGLYRYRSGDRIQVTDFLACTPTFRLLGRSKSTSDICGEKLHEIHVKRAIDKSLQYLNIDATFCMLAANDLQPPTHYELFIALTNGQQQILLDKLKCMLEVQLCANPHYAYARKLGQLRALSVCQVGEDAPSRYLKRMQSNGQQLGNIKPAILSNMGKWRSFLK